MRATKVGIICICLMLVAADSSMPQAQQALAGITGLWPEGRVCAVTITFDDANPYHADVITPLLLRYGLKATFFLNLGGMVFAHPEDEGRKPRADWNHYRMMHAAGMEIGSHTVWHKDLTRLPDAEIEYEVKTSKDRIEYYLGNKVRSFAYPFNAFNQRTERVVRDTYSFARVGNVRREMASLDLYVDNDGTDLYKLRAVVVQADTSVSRLKQYVDKAQKRGAWLVFQFHGVNELGPAPHSAAYFEEFFQYLAAKTDVVWVGTLDEVGSYVRARLRPDWRVKEFEVIELPPDFAPIAEPDQPREN